MSERESVVAWWSGGERSKRIVWQTGTRKVGGDEYDAFIILMVAMVLQEYAFIKTNEIIDLKYAVYCVAITSQ